VPKNDTSVNKAQAIRDFLADHPDASPRNAAEALVAQGIQVTPAFVATVKAMRESPPQPVPESDMPPRQISFGEGKLFYKLYAALCSYANGKLNVVAGEFSDPEQFTSLPPEIRLKVRDALHAHPELIDQFVQEDPSPLTAEELAIVASWKHAVAGKFYVFRYLKRYAVFLSENKPPRAYGVLALASPFEEVVGTHLPVLTKAVLLPINGRIIYDGLLSSYRISYGPGIRWKLNEDYKQAKKTIGIITSLPEGQTLPPIAKKKAPKKKPAGGGTGDVKAIFEVIVEMTDAFCEAYLNGEYADLCRKLAAVLARKRPSPLTRGKWETWACGIVRTVGWVNFLDDPTQTPHMTLTFIDKAFGVAESTGQGKSKTIRNLLKIRQFDPKWTLPSKMDDNPMIWMVEVNGFLMDLRQASRELQEVAYEKGIIPYIPADRGGDPDDKE
jgi:hypothetical protein